VGYPAQSLLGHSPLEFFAEPEADFTATPFAAREPVSEIDVWFHRADGTVACLVATAVPLFGPEGDWCGARGVCRDISETRDREAALARAQVRERLLAHLTRTIRDEIEPARILETAATATAKALQASGCIICRCGEDGVMRPAAEWGNQPWDTGGESSLLAQIGGGKSIVTEHGDQALLCIGTSYRHAQNGALILGRHTAAGSWTTEERSLAADVATQLGVAIAQINNHLRLEALSRTDGLTGLLNRPLSMRNLSDGSPVPAPRRRRDRSFSSISTTSSRSTISSATTRGTRR
jgi:hypothetical protein